MTPSPPASPDTRIGHPWGRWDYLYAGVLFALAVVLLWQTLLPGKILYGADSIYAAQVFWRYGMEFFREHWRLPYWNPYLMGGMPFIGSLSASISPFDWFFLPFELLGIQLPFSTYLLFHITLGGLFAYLYLGELRLNRYACWMGGLTFAFNNYMISRIFPGHGGKLCVLVLLPLGMYLLRRGVRERKVPWLLGFGLVVGIQYLQRHPQILFYCLLTYVAYFFFFALPIGERKGQWDLFTRLAAVCLVAGALGMGVAMIDFWPQYEYKHYTLRGEEGKASPQQKWAFNTSWSLPPEEVINFVVQNPFGWDIAKSEQDKVKGAGLTRYKGRMNARQAYEYMGVLPMILAALALLYAFGNREVRFHGLWTLLSLGLAMGKYSPIYIISHALFPPFSYFRVPIETISVTTFSLCVLTAFGLHALQDRIAERGLPGMRRTLIALAGVTAFLLIVPAMLYFSRGFVSGILRGMPFVAMSMMNGDTTDLLARVGHFAAMGVRAGIFMLVSLGLVAAASTVGERRRKLMYGGMIAFAWLDIHSLNRLFIVTVDKANLEDYFTPVRAIPILQHDKGIFRVFSQQVERYPNEYMVGRLETISGYHPMPLHFYHMLIRQVAGIGNHVFDMLNTKYLVLPNSQNYQLPLAKGSAEWPVLERYRLIYQTEGWQIYENRDAFGAARLVYSAVQVPSHEAALQAVGAQDFDPTREVLHVEPLPADLRLPGQPVQGGSVAVDTRDPENIVLQVNAPSDAMLVFSEVWFPGWHVTIDGGSAPVYRVNAVLRGVPVKAGQHEVTMRFRPLSDIGGKWLTLISMAILLGGMVLTRGLSARILPAPAFAGVVPNRRASNDASREGRKKRHGHH